jgi:hypothetical protein
MSYKLLDQDSFEYRKLIEEFPNNAPFYYYEYEGDYYNKAFTEFFNRYQKSIKVKVHDYYG